MAEYRYDVVVIGAGPAGESAAINAAKHGKKVAIVENKHTVGGGCTHLRTIPSKALRHAVKHIIHFNTNPMFRDIGEPSWFSFPKVLRYAEDVIEKQVRLRTEYLARNKITIISGSASFVDKNTIDVIVRDNTKKRLHFSEAVIATGSSPWRPSNIDFSHPRVYDSDTILQLDHTPRTIIIYGA